MINGWLLRQLTIARDRADATHLEVKPVLVLTRASTIDNSPSVPSKPMNAQASEINNPLAKDPNWTDP